MADALTIDFALTNADKVERAFARFAALTSAGAKNLSAMAAAADAATSAYQKLNRQIARFNKLTGASTGMVPAGTSSAGSSSSAGGSTGGSSATRAKFVQGPFQRQAMLAQQFTAASATGDRRAMVDIRLAQRRNQKQIDVVNAPEKTLGSKFLDVLKTSRFSMGGGKATLMPLVGRSAALIAEALGPQVAALAGGVGIAVGAVVSLGKGLYDLAQGAADTASAFTKAGLEMGNIGSGAATADRFGRAAGLTPAETASVANSIQAAITGSGIGRAMGLQAGMFNIAGPYGDQDRSKLVVKAFNHLRSLKSLSAREAFARTTGSEALLPGAMVSDKQLSRGNGDAAVTSQIFDAKFQTDAADFQDAVGRVQTAFGNLMAALGKPLVEQFTNLLNQLADTFNKMALWLNGPSGKTFISGLETVAKTMGDLAGAGALSKGSQFNNSADSIIDRWGEKMDANDAERQKNDELKRNTNALQDLSGKIPGVYGRDVDGRLRNALPGAAGYEADSHSRQEMIRQSFRLGAF